MDPQTEKVIRAFINRVSKDLYVKLGADAVGVEDFVVGRMIYYPTVDAYNLATGGLIPTVMRSGVMTVETYPVNLYLLGTPTKTSVATFGLIQYDEPTAEELADW
jgi:hypothetical protein